MVNGTFQKSGGTIYGIDASNAALRNRSLISGTNNVRNNANAIAIFMKSEINPTITGDSPQVRLRNNTTDSFVTLYVESSKTANTTAGTNFIPEWARSFWDN